MKSILARAEEAAKADFDKQKSFESAYDRRKGFMAGVQWAAQQMQKKIEKSHKKVSKKFQKSFTIWS